MKRSAIGGLAAVVVVALGACGPGAAAFGTNDEAAVKALFDSTTVSVRSGNMDAWASLFAEDAHFAFGNQKLLTGRAAILAWGKALPKILSFTLGPATIKGEGNLAYGISSIEAQMTGLPADTAKQLVIFHRDSNGKWWVQEVSVSSDLPIPMPAAAPAKKKE